MNYIVLRQHFGDRQYFSGEIRPIDDKMVADKLIKLGVLADPSQKPTDDKANDKPDDKASQKLAPRPKNKMAKAPQNKAQNNQDDKSDKGNP